MPLRFQTLPDIQARLIYTGYIPVPALALTLPFEFRLSVHGKESS